MKRFTLTAVASALVLSLAPASALAGHHHKSKRHHSRVHHVRVRHLRFGDMTGSSSNTTTTPTTTPSDTAGTVASFTPASGTTPASLTIKLNDAAGTLVTAAFTDATSLECQTAEQADNQANEPVENDASESSQTMHADGDHSGGGDNQGGGGDQGGNGGDNGDQGGDEQGAQSQSCTTANLTAGAVVSGAEIRISSAGEAWDKVELSL